MASKIENLLNYKLINKVLNNIDITMYIKHYIELSFLLEDIVTLIE